MWPCVLFAVLLQRLPEETGGQHGGRGEVRRRLVGTQRLRLRLFLRHDELTQGHRDKETHQVGGDPLYALAVRHYRRLRSDISAYRVAASRAYDL